MVLLLSLHFHAGDVHIHTSPEYLLDEFRQGTRILGSNPLQNMLERAKWSEAECGSDQEFRHLGYKTKLNTKDRSLLPKMGAANAIRERTHSSISSTVSHPICSMPPAKSCGENATATHFTVVIMSHNTDRFQKLTKALMAMMRDWGEVGLTEIIFVWNAPRSTLEESVSLNKVADTTTLTSMCAANILKWNADPANPLRIFFALENGLQNNLLNRYHPMLAPMNDAVVFFDDDGPFFTISKDNVQAGIELWKRHSDIQVGTYGRHLMFTSDRINNHLDVVHSRTLRHHITGGASTRHETTLEHKTLNENAGPSKAFHNDFIPLCPDDSANQDLTYHRDDFSDFGSRVILPTGSIIHRKYLCWIWHPAFE